MSDRHLSEVNNDIAIADGGIPCTQRQVCKLLNELSEENEQLKKQLNDITLEWKQNLIEFNKDELYVKDNNTEITLKNQNLLIQVYIPKIKEHLRFNYIVTGRRLEREYNTLKGDVE